MDLKERVSMYCDKKNITISKFEKLSGLANGYFNKVTKRPSEDKLESISRAFSDLNTIWLLTGEGEMLKTSPQPTEERSIGNTEGLHIVPLLPISAQGGSFNDFVTSIKENECDKARHHRAQVRTHQHPLRQTHLHLQRPLNGHPPTGGNEVDWS